MSSSVSPPRTHLMTIEFVWFIPRYGRYTKAAILHDYLCSVCVPARRVSRIEADGIFRQAMRELGVPFLQRWIMWAAVRWGALTKGDGREDWWKEAPRVVLITVLALPVVAPPAIVIAVALLAYWVVELLAWVPLKLTQRAKLRRGKPAKKVNAPALHIKL